MTAVYEIKPLHFTGTFEISVDDGDDPIEAIINTLRHDMKVFSEYEMMILEELIKNGEVKRIR